MKQQSFSSQAVFEKYGRKSRRELFLDEMEKVVSVVCDGVFGAPALREGGPRPAAGGSVDHAPDIFCATVVQLVGPWGGGTAV